MKQAFLVLLVLYSTEQQEVTLDPAGVLASAQGGGVRVTCFSSATITEVEWTVNGTAIQNQNLTNVSTEFVDSGSLGQTGVLTFSSLPLEYNATNISCTVITASGRLSANEHILLLVQGLLPAVGSLMISVDTFFSVVFLSWTAPFTLDIYDTEPDVTYCVDAVNFTFAKTLLSECEINETKFAYPLPPSAGCGGIFFTVTSVNVVGNGTGQNTFLAIKNRPEVVQWILSSKFTLLLVMSAPVCSGRVTFTDVDTGMKFTGRDSDVAIAVTNITFSTEKLRKNRHYDVIVLASNIVGTNTLNYSLSTHDIRNATFNITGSFIGIEIDYFEHSNLSGALLTISSSETVDLAGAAYLALERNLLHNYTLSFSLNQGGHSVLIYDIESNGTLLTGMSYPAVERELITNFTGEGSLFKPSYIHLKTCVVSASASQIVTECQYSDNSLATAFQVIVQCSDCSQVNRLYVNQTLPHHTSASIQVKDNGLYQVTVFPIRGERGIVGSSVEHSQQLNIQGSLAGALFAILIGASIIITLLVVGFKRQHSKPETVELNEYAELKDQVSYIQPTKRNENDELSHGPNEAKPDSREIPNKSPHMMLNGSAEAEDTGSSLQVQVPVYSRVDKRKKKNPGCCNETSAYENECHLSEVINGEVVYANLDCSNQGSLRKSSTVSDENKRDKSVLVYEVAIPRNCARVDTFQTCSDVNQVVYAELLGNK